MRLVQDPARSKWPAFTSFYERSNSTLGARGFSRTVSGFGQVLKSDPKTSGIVCYTAVFSVVTQRSSPLRDDTKNGCVADYLWYGRVE